MTAVDVLVVGGGPSGLSAATAAAESGSSAMLVDEWPDFGGNLRYRRGADEERGRLVERARGSSVDLRPGTVAWGSFATGTGIEVGVHLRDGTSDVLTPERLILATGTTDRAATIPGATLPGVLTSRALLTLVNVHGVLPGRRFAILGDVGAATLTGEIGMAGGDVVRHVVGPAVAVAEIEGEGQVERVVVGGERFAVDVVVTALGAVPDTQLYRMMGGGVVKGVHLVGSAAGDPTPTLSPAARIGDKPHDGWLCRCECVSAGSVEAAVMEGNRTINDVKRRTRAGMGICQGIYCVDHIAASLVAAGVDLATIEPMTPRPPTRLTALGTLDGI